MEVDGPVAVVTSTDNQGESTPPMTQSQQPDPEKDTSDPMQADEDDAVEY